MKNNLKNEILGAICSGRVVSGGELASKLGISRTAVWKAVNSLRAEGFFISGEAGGYAISPKNTRLCGEQLRAYVGGDIIFKDETFSTNDDVKELAAAGASEFSVVVARRQSGGKGRLGRNFFSPEGGLYFSVLLRPETSVEASLKITTAAAVAMARAIEKVANKTAQIKWVNDIYIGSKKVCGILTEGAFDAENGKLKYAALGIGVNVATPKGGFTGDIADTAGALFETSACPSLIYCALLNEFLKNFKEYYENIAQMPHIDEYRRRSFLTGKTVVYEKDGKEYTATVSGITDLAELIVTYKGKEQILSSGQVRILSYDR